MNTAKVLYLIDGSAFLYRGYYALRPLHTKKGIPVQAVYSFCRMVKKLMSRFDPTYMGLVWDSKGKTVRHDIYPDYKATRQAPPSDLFEQKEYIAQFAHLIGLTQVAQPGIEADDLMYTVACQYVQQGFKVVLITSDKDMGQALGDQVTIFDPYKDQVIDATSFAQKMGFGHQKLPFYHALVGDASDNIPGVKGIGPKGATELVLQFESLQDLYNNLDAVAKERTRTLLRGAQHDAFLSQQLFELRSIPLHETYDFAFDHAKWAHALPLFVELEFTSLIKEISPPSTQEPKVATIPFAKMAGYAFKAVTTVEQLTQVCNELIAAGAFGLDAEGTGLDPLQDELVGLSLSTRQGLAYYVPFGHTTGQQLTVQQVFEQLKPILQNPAYKKYLHNAKFDMLYFYQYGIRLEGVVFDTMIAANLVLKDWQRIGLKYLSELYFNEQMLSFADVVKSNKFKNFAQVPLELAVDYAAADAHQTLRLQPLLAKQLDEFSVYYLFTTIEMPLMQVLFDMECAGITLDPSVLKELDTRVCADLTRIEADIHALIGQLDQPLNLNSPKQLAHLLFEVLKLPPQKKKATGYSTDVEVLEILAEQHPVPGLIMRYRELYKLKSTYIDALPLYINPKTGKIHTNFSQITAATGRLASSEPNLQNIPTDSTGYGIEIRAAFKPDLGHVFISADYAQIELKVLAYLSKDPNLLASIKSGQDIHAGTAARLFDVELAAVTHEQRQLGKRINFSILYGLTPYGLSKDLKIPFADAKKYIEKYFAQYPGVQAWMDRVIQETKDTGYVTTHWGRRRYIPGIYERNRSLYDLAKRVAINTKAQGTAAEIMKIGMIKLDQAFKRHKLNARMLLQIHDELLISVAIDQAPQAQQVIKEVLESVVDWDVPLSVSVRVGMNWKEISK